jgi:hypothetical protein
MVAAPMDHWIIHNIPLIRRDISVGSINLFCVWVLQRCWVMRAWLAGLLTSGSNCRCYISQQEIKSLSWTAKCVLACLLASLSLPRQGAHMRAWHDWSLSRAQWRPRHGLLLSFFKSTPNPAGLGQLRCTHTHGSMIVSDASENGSSSLNQCSHALCMHAMAALAM